MLYWHSLHTIRIHHRVLLIVQLLLMMHWQLSVVMSHWIKTPFHFLIVVGFFIINDRPFLSINDQLLKCIEHTHLLLVEFVLNNILKQHHLVEVDSEILPRYHPPSS